MSEEQIVDDFEILYVAYEVDPTMTLEDRELMYEKPMRLSMDREVVDREVISEEWIDRVQDGVPMRGLEVKVKK